METKLPGIAKIYYVDTDSLPKDIVKKAIANIPIGIFCEKSLIGFVGTPTCVSDTENSNNGCLSKTVLKFKSATGIKFDSHLAFIIEDMDNVFHLIGSYEPPFADCKVGWTSGSTDADPSVFSYEITLTNILSCIKCVV